MHYQPVRAAARIQVTGHVGHAARIAAPGLDALIDLAVPRRVPAAVNQLGGVPLRIQRRPGRCDVVRRQVGFPGVPGAVPVVRPVDASHAMGSVYQAPGARSEKVTGPPAGWPASRWTKAASWALVVGE